VTEIKVDDIPQDQITYFKRAEPIIRFLDWLTLTS